MGGPSPLCLGATPGVCKKAGQANQEKQASKHHCPVASAPRFLPGVPAPTSLDDGLQTMRRNKAFPPQVAFGMVFYLRNRNPGWDCFVWDLTVAIVFWFPVYWFLFLLLRQDTQENGLKEGFPWKAVLVRLTGSRRRCWLSALFHHPLFIHSGTRCSHSGWVFSPH